MHLFDGEMELPEEAGQALGTLLGDAVKPAPRAAVDDEPIGKLDLEAELPEAGPLRRRDGESTRVAAADEFDQLLADTAGHRRQRLGAASPRRRRARTVEEQSIPSIDIDSDPGFGAGVDARGGGGEVDQLLADADDVEKESAAGAAAVGRVQGADLARAGLEAGEARDVPARRGASRPSRAATRRRRAASQRRRAGRGAEDSRPRRRRAADDLEVEMELGAAVEQAVTAPPPVDEDFYDDIVVEAAREQPIDKPSPPSRPPPPPPRAPADAPTPRRRRRSGSVRGHRRRRGRPTPRSRRARAPAIPIARRCPSPKAPTSSAARSRCA